MLNSYFIAVRAREFLSMEVIRLFCWNYCSVLGWAALPRWRYFSFQI